MNPSLTDISQLIIDGRLGDAIRGEIFVLLTPPEVNDDMRPTDHDELLKRIVYPLAGLDGKFLAQLELQKALQKICRDPLGIFCAIQCYYIEIVNEDAHISPLMLDRESLPKFLASQFIKHSDGLRALEIRFGDLANERSYRVTLSRMRILKRDHGLDWGIELPPF